MRRALTNWTHRDHVFQALATGAAYGSPLAVVVYPERFEPHWWNVEGFGGKPQSLVAMGLGLYSYRAGAGDVDTGTRLLGVTAGRPSPIGTVATWVQGRTDLPIAHGDALDALRRGFPAARDRTRAAHPANSR